VAGEAVTSDAKVGQQDVGASLKQDVLRLNVVVDNALIVGILHRIAKLREERHGFGAWERLAAPLEQVAQRPFMDERHHQIQCPVFFAKIEQG
jgi:hypothetical protein